MCIRDRNDYLFVCLYVKVEYVEPYFDESQGGNIGTFEKSPGKRSTEYQEVDLLKTRALKKALDSTRKAQEMGRKSSEQSLVD